MTKRKPTATPEYDLLLRQAKLARIHDIAAHLMERASEIDGLIIAYSTVEPIRQDILPKPKATDTSVSEPAGGDDLAPPDEQYYYNRIGNISVAIGLATMATNHFSTYYAQPLEDTDAEV